MEDQALKADIEKWSADLCTPQAVASLLGRLIELEEVAFSNGQPYWTACGDFVDEIVDSGDAE